MILNGFEDLSFVGQWQIFDYANNHGFYYNLMFYPYIDYYLLADGLIDKPKWPEGKEFAVALTHDVDTAGKYNRREYLNRLKCTGFPKNKESWARIIANSQSYVSALLQKGRLDPYADFDAWLEIENEYKAKSTFYFFPEHVSKRDALRDCMYEFSDKIMFAGGKTSIADLMKKLDGRGWEVGLHPSVFTATDRQMLNEQKEQIEVVLAKKICSLRQHCLRFDPATTPTIQAKAGFRYDSSYGFNRTIGFRAGTSYPFEIRAGDASILEIPLIIQDGGLFIDSYLGVSEEKALWLCKALIDRVKKVGGVMVLLWHPHYASNTKWISTYKKLLAYVYQEKGWMANIKEIGQYWENNCKRKFQPVVENTFKDIKNTGFDEFIKKNSILNKTLGR